MRSLAWAGLVGAVLALAMGCEGEMPAVDGGVDSAITDDAGLDAAADADVGADVGMDAPMTMDSGPPLMQSCEGAVDLGSALGLAVATGTTVGETDDVMPECASGSRGASDVVYRWAAPTAGRFVFDTYGSGYDTVLHLRGADCALMACADDSVGRSVQSHIALELEAGAVLMVAVDGTGASRGDYVLNIGQPPESEADCFDGLDEDRDGSTDCRDGDCDPEPACHEVVCDDGIDNDGDGGSDCGDFDCIFGEPCAETECGDGIDGDFDAEIDCDDFDCWESEPCLETMCTDGVDADMDGMTDCADDDCTCDPACGAPDTCPGADLESRTGTGVAIGDNYLGCNLREPESCDVGTALSPGSGQGTEATFTWTAPAAGDYSFDTFGSDYDTTLYVRDGGCDAAQLACSEDAAATSVSSRLVLTVTTGQRLTIFVDSFGGSAGAYVLSILPL